MYEVTHKQLLSSKIMHHFVLTIKVENIIVEYIDK